MAVVPRRGAAVAAIERRAAAVGTVVAAALALPGVAPAQMPDESQERLLTFKHLDYRDRQPGLERVHVSAPTVLLRLPVDRQWGLEASLGVDRVSGASPRYHTAVSSASRMSDRREAGDVKVTRYGEDRSSWSAGAVWSGENDFRSRGFSAQYGTASDDNNRSWLLALAHTVDRIGSSDDPDLHRGRHTSEATVTLTQALSRQDLVQVSVGASVGRGYYDDPYKRLDQRPDARRSQVLSLRWNHHFEGPDISLRTSLRAYRDSFGIASQTLHVEPVWTLGERVELAPSLRLYTQRAARFYYDPVYSYLGPPYPPGWLEAPPRHLSADQRLAGFGAVTAGIKMTLRLPRGWSTDLRVEHYAQRAGWRVGGRGSPGLAPFSARMWQWGVTCPF